MSLYQIRPLGLRENLAGFELRCGPLPAGEPGRDLRELFTLWDPQGRFHTAYPEMELRHPMTGREVMAWQQAAWQAHIAAARRLFGAAPLAGTPRADALLRGLLLFPVPLFSDRGRWTLKHRTGMRWYFTPAQLRDGLPHLLPPAREDG